MKSSRVSCSNPGEPSSFRTIEFPSDETNGVCNDGDNYQTIKLVDVDGNGFSEISYRSQNPDGSGYTTEFLDNTDQVPHAAYSVRTQTFSGGESYEYFNRRGKSVATRTLSHNHQWVMTRNTYDRYSHKVATSLPYFINFPGLTPQNTILEAKTTQRDDLNRATEVENPAGDLSRIEFGVNAQGAHYATTTNERNLSKTVVSNLLGKMRQVTDERQGVVEYRYNADGQMTHMINTTSANAITATEYDRLGRKYRVVDPDKGTYTFTYDGLGQLITQTNSRGMTVCFVYDELGRTRLRVDHYTGNVSTAASTACAENNASPAQHRTYEWVYDQGTLSNGRTALGLLSSSIKHEVNHSTQYQYDHLGRVLSSEQEIGVYRFQSQQTFDRFGRGLTQTFPSGLRIRNVYDDVGTLIEIRNDVTGGRYWSLVELNAEGQVVRSTQGNGVSLSKTIDPATSLLQQVVARNANNHIRQDMSFGYDAVNNLVRRADNMRNWDETFIYDELNRLTFSSIDGHTSYAANGNIQNKPGLSHYQYGGTCEHNGQTIQAGPHAVTSVQIEGQAQAIEYCYDAGGNRVSGNGQYLEYDINNKPTLMEREGSLSINRVQFTYGISSQRIYRRDTVRSTVTETFYGASGYEFIITDDLDNDANDQREEKHYVGPAVITITNHDPNQIEEHYLLTDHLGSTVGTLDIHGEFVDEIAFDAWGSKRNEDTTPILDELMYYGKLTRVTEHGFTGHKHVGPIGLIHMNGRVYDPILGRFLSADPIIQSPGNSQSLNRYSYLMNNPLSGTDPTGYIGGFLGRVLHAFQQVFVPGVELYKGIRKSLKHQIQKNPEFFQAVGTVACFGAGPAAPACIGAVNSYITYELTGSFSQALGSGMVAFAQAFAWNQVGNFLDTPRPYTRPYSPLTKVLVHGTVGGALALFTGGEFKSGFVSNLTSKAFYEFGGGFGGGDAGLILNSIESYIVGGTASVLSGGSFASGGQTAMMARLYNDLSHINLDNLQFALDAAGLAPGIGNFADGASGLISLFRGDVKGAFERFSAMVPGAGQAVTARRWARKLTCCFVAGTKVLTLTGFKNIEDIREGDLVYAKNVETGEQDWKPVTHLFNKYRLIYDLTVKNETGHTERIKTTDDHPFYVTGVGFVDTVDLQPGQIIETENHSKVTVESAVTLGEYQTTYNLEVDDFHTYYATEHVLLVHNCNVAKEQREVIKRFAERKVS